MFSIVDILDASTRPVALKAVLLICCPDILPLALILPVTVSFSAGLVVPIPTLPPSSKTISPPSVSTNLAIG